MSQEEAAGEEVYIRSESERSDNSDDLTDQAVDEKDYLGFYVDSAAGKIIGRWMPREKRVVDAEGNDLNKAAYTKKKTKNWNMFARTSR